MSKTLRMNGVVLPSDGGKLEEFNEETQQWEPFKPSELSNILNLSTAIDLINVVLPDESYFTSTNWLTILGGVDQTKDVKYKEFNPVLSIAYALTGELTLTEFRADLSGSGAFDHFKQEFSIRESVVLQDNIPTIVRLYAPSGLWIEYIVVNDLVSKKIGINFNAVSEGSVAGWGTHGNELIRIDYKKTLDV